MNDEISLMTRVLKNEEGSLIFFLSYLYKKKRVLTNKYLLNSSFFEVRMSPQLVSLGDLYFKQEIF